MVSSSRARPSARRNCCESLQAMRRPPATRPWPIICTMARTAATTRGAEPLGQSSLRGRTTPLPVGMVDALVPGARALRELGVVADGVDGGLQDAVLPRLGVLRHEEHVALLLAADLVDELSEASGVGQVDVGVGLHAVAVAAGDEQHVPFLGQAADGAVLIPVAQAVQARARGCKRRFSAGTR